MKITLRRSGGVTGVLKTVQLDTANLASTKTKQLHDLVAESAFFKLPALGATANRPDAFEYDLAIDTGIQNHRVTFHETAANPALKKLARAVESLA